MQEKRIYRSCHNRIIAGVCGGIGEYFDIDPVLIRLIFALLALTGTSIIFYFLAWLIIPNDPSCGLAHKDAPEEIKDKANEFARDLHDFTKKDGRINGGRAVVGVIIILVGVASLLQSIFGVDIWSNFWPLILIVLGLAFIFSSKR